MLVEVKYLWCPIAGLELAEWKKEELELDCRSLAGDCKSCEKGIIVTGFRMVKKPKTIQPAARNECPGC